MHQPRKPAGRQGAGSRLTPQAHRPTAVSSRSSLSMHQLAAAAASPARLAQLASSFAANSVQRSAPVPPSVHPPQSLQMPIKSSRSAKASSSMASRRPSLVPSASASAARDSGLAAAASAPRNIVPIAANLPLSSHGSDRGGMQSKPAGRLIADSQLRPQPQPAARPPPFNQRLLLPAIDAAEGDFEPGAMDLSVMQEGNTRSASQQRLTKMKQEQPKSVSRSWHSSSAPGQSLAHLPYSAA